MPPVDRSEFNGRFRSLRIRLLLPVAAVALLAAIGVAACSYWFGARVAGQQIDSRFGDIADTLAGVPYPLNEQVVDSLAQLTDTDLITLRADGSVVNRSLKKLSVERQSVSVEPIDTSQFELPVATARRLPDRRTKIFDHPYYFGVFRRGGPAASSDDVDRVVVLFDEAALLDARYHAAALPLITGLSTVLLLTTVSLLLTNRLVRRLRRLGQDVDEIAKGNFSNAEFDTQIAVGAHDEVGLLGAGVQRMSAQLSQMWNSLHRTQGEKLLHQIAGGLAHQLRNSLTGARMAVELHQKSEPNSNSRDSLSVAIDQLEQTEDTVRRLLLVAAGKQAEDHPGSAGQAIRDVRESLSPTAHHLRIEVDWEIDPALDEQFVTDAPSLAAAISNLILNAMQVAKQVRVIAAKVSSGDLYVEVFDNGPGPPKEIAHELFEPFVTSKPEGLGLGLPLVARAAARLGGKVEWERRADETRFVITSALSDLPQQTSS